MCTILLLRDPDAAWPLLVAANRDELRARAWEPPGRHWPDRPNVIAGRDVLAGGSWLGLNDEGVMAAVLNRTGSLGPDPSRRSRGELVLEALDHAEAGAAAEALADLNPEAYRTFNLVIADAMEAYWIRNAYESGGNRLSVHEIPAGYSMITSADRNDTAAPRIRDYLPRFVQSRVPDPDTGNWLAWETLLASRHHAATEGPSEALNIDTGNGFGTVSSALIALPKPGMTRASDGLPERPVWRFAAGPPDQLPFEDVRDE